MPVTANRTTPAIGRRGALAALLAAAPFVARAQTPAAPVAPPQIITPAVPPPGAAPALPTTPRPTVPVGAIDKTKIYYVFFDQTIDLNSLRALRHQLAALVEAGVAQIELVISSPGGLVSPTLLTYHFIRSLPATVNTHAQGLVASAANVLFLAGQDRSADPSAKFIFHPSQAPLIGTMTQQQIQEQLAQFETVDGMMTEIYHDRTKLTDEAIAKFSHGVVTYSASQAEQAGIVQSVAELKLPTAQTARILFLD